MKKVQNFVKFSKTFPKYLNDKRNKIKQFLSYTLMIRKQNIPATLMIFLNLLKMLLQNIVTKKQSPKVLLMNF